MTRLLLVMLLFAMPLEAQAIYAPDRWIERQEWIPPQLHDQDWKTWGWHGAFTVGGGSLIGALTPLSHRQGRHVMAVFYVVRELYGVLWDDNRKYGDAFMDAAVPIVVARVRF